MEVKLTRKTKSPRICRSKFDCKCEETGKEIKKGELILYYPSSKSVYCLQSDEYKSYLSIEADRQMTGLDI